MIFGRSLYKEAVDGVFQPCSASYGMTEEQIAEYFKTGIDTRIDNSI